MQLFHERQAVAIVRQMIHAFQIEKDVDKVLSFVNPEKFTWIGYGENLVMNDVDEIKNFFRSRVEEFTAAYKIIDENYFVSASSADSCVVVAQLSMRGLGVRENHFPKIHFSFYLQLVDNRLVVSHYHVHSPVTNERIESAESFFLGDRNGGTFNMVDMQYQNRILYNFFDSTGVAMKCFFYEKDFPYCYVNKAFQNLVGAKNIRSFRCDNNFSSLAHIHPNDQQRYIKRLEECFAQAKSEEKFQSDWRWRASYYLSYRLQTFDRAEKSVFEWGNLFTLNGRPLVNSYILQIDVDSDCDVPPPREIFFCKRRRIVGRAKYFGAARRFRHSHW